MLTGQSKDDMCCLTECWDCALITKVDHELNATEPIYINHLAQRPKLRCFDLSQDMAADLPDPSSSYGAV